MKTSGLPETGAAAAEISRTPWFKRPWFLVSVVVFLAAVVAFATSDTVRFFALAHIYGVQGGQSLDEAASVEAAVTSAITSVHHFTRNSVLQPDEPPIVVHSRISTDTEATTAGQCV
jgi:hypothetical protein